MKKQYDDDDGRTIVDMSGIEAPSMFGHIRSREDTSGKKPAPFSEHEKEVPQPAFSKNERRWAILGALNAALIIGGIFVVGLGVLIFLLLMLWT